MHTAGCTLYPTVIVPGATLARVPGPRGYQRQSSVFTWPHSSAFHVSDSAWCQWSEEEGASRRVRTADATIGTLSWTWSTLAIVWLATTKYLFWVTVKVRAGGLGNFRLRLSPRVGAFFFEQTQSLFWDVKQDL